MGFFFQQIIKKHATFGSIRRSSRITEEMAKEKKKRRKRGRGRRKKEEEEEEEKDSWRGDDR